MGPRHHLGVAGDANAGLDGSAVAGQRTIIAVRSHGSREGKPQDETRCDVSSLRTGAKALLKAIRQRWAIENSWHWVRDVPLRKDAQRYREDNGIQILATLRSLAINALRLDGIWTITEGIAPWLKTSKACSGCWDGDPRQKRPQNDF